MDGAPLILLTNDDGIYSPGLHAAIAAVAHLGELLIVAPRTQQTAMGRALTNIEGAGTIERVSLPIEGTTYPAFAVTGTPALAVAHAVLELAPRLPSLCISGVNYGENIGATITSSGTVGAALEAAAFGVPSVAMSLEVASSVSHAGDYIVMDWAAAAYFTRLFAERVLRNGLPAEIAVLNVNIPGDATRETAIRVTRQAPHLYYEWTPPPTRDHALAYRLRKEIVHPADDLLDAESDVAAFVRDRVVSVTPLTSDMTARLDRQRWFAGFQ